MKTILGITKNNMAVVDRYNSHIHGDLMELIKEALSKIEVKGFTVTSYDFSEVIGECSLVETVLMDEIVYAQRHKRNGLTRFVKNKKPKKSKSLTMVLMPSKEKTDEFILITAFIGKPASVEPWDPKATSKDVMFWRNNAIIWDGDVIPGTETEIRPDSFKINLIKGE